jgi:hypothetical protein
VKYKVIWHSRAETQMAAIWLASKRPQEIAYAAKRLERLMELHGDIAGESREPNRRVVFSQPLLMYYRIIEKTKTIEIINVRETK